MTESLLKSCSHRVTMRIPCSIECVLQMLPDLFACDSFEHGATYTYILLPTAAAAGAVRHVLLEAAVALLGPISMTQLY